MSKTNGEHRDNQLDWRILRDDCLKDLVAEKQEKVRLKPLTHNQAIYYRAIERSIITFCTGPAGTGKTYIPCGLAVEELQAGKTGKVVMTRPLVSCGRDRVGFLPGDLMAKVSPYMRPMTDTLIKFMGVIELEDRMRKGQIEIVPMEYMRGLSIDNSWIIADEMQNADKEQWKMLLTRIGQSSKLIASGDDTQSDLPVDGADLMNEAINHLKGEKDISSVILTLDDIVRSGIVGRIVRKLANW